MTRAMPLLCLLAAGCDMYTYETVTLSLDAQEIETLRFDVGAGDLRMVGDAGATEIVVEATVRGFDADPCPAMDALQLTLLGDGSVADLSSGFSESYAGIVDLYVTVPARLVVDGYDDTGDISIENIAGLVLSDTTGDVRLSRIAGDVWLEDETGDISVDGVSGDVSIEDTTGDIVVAAAGTVTVWDTTGDIYIRSASAVDIVEDSTGDVVIR